MHKFRSTVLFANGFTDEDTQQFQRDIAYTVRLAACDANKYLKQFLRYDFIWLYQLRLKTLASKTVCTKIQTTIFATMLMAMATVTPMPRQMDYAI